MAIVPARGGSRGLPRKNLLPLAGIPLVARAILAARACPHVAGCLLSTDDPDIRAVGVEYGADIVDRPAGLAGDLATSEGVVRHALDVLAAAGTLPEYFVLLQPTSPLRTGAHITACIEAFFQRSAQSAISVTESRESPFKAFVEKDGALQPLFDIEALHAPRQTLPLVYNQNGAIYLTSSSAFLRENRLFIPPVMPFVMDAVASIDIDTALDWRIAACLISG
ncbi:MAG: acylneuraminate cytidylyltransferase family protein [Bryobacteraceae bacterium]